MYMNKIIVKKPINNQEWNVSIDTLTRDYLHLCFCFTDNGSKVDLRGIKFGYELKQNNNIKYYGMYPQPNTRFVSSDEEFLVTKTLNLDYDTEYTLYLWTETKAHFSEHTKTFTTPSAKID